MKSRHDSTRRLRRRATSPTTRGSSSRSTCGGWYSQFGSVSPFSDCFLFRVLCAEANRLQSASSRGPTLSTIRLRGSQVRSRPCSSYDSS